MVSMDTYEVEMAPFKPKLKGKVIAVLLCAGVFFALRLGMIFLWPSEYEKSGGLGGFVIEIAVVSLGWGLWMVFLTPILGPIWGKRDRKIRFIVDGDSITAEYAYWPKRTLRRTVRKGKVRSIFEIKGTSLRPEGIGISEKSKFGARMFGFVYVPRTLPQFEELKRIAESWRIGE
jgi:hypothetical protein